MKQLAWHTPENPCLLCGIEVTPMAVFGQGWIVEQDGHWFIPSGKERSDDGDVLYDWKFAKRAAVRSWTCCSERSIGSMNYLLDDCRPIFPPRGWAGKTDAELFREMAGEYEFFVVVARYDWDWGGCQHYREVRVWDTGAVMEMAPGDVGGSVKRHGSANTFSWLDADRLALVILALQNAQVLAARLKEGV